MSESITLEQFEEKMGPVSEEASKLNSRLRALRDEFFKLANTVVPADDENDTFTDTMFEYASNFIDGIDYEYSSVKPGKVEIWQQSTC